MVELVFIVSCLSNPPHRSAYYKQQNKCFEISSEPPADEVFVKVSEAIDKIERGEVAVAVDINSHAM